VIFISEESRRIAKRLESYLSSIGTSACALIHLLLISAFSVLIFTFHEFIGSILDAICEIYDKLAFLKFHILQIKTKDVLMKNFS
jgi:hypothetical protein